MASCASDVFSMLSCGRTLPDGFVWYFNQPFQDRCLECDQSTLAFRWSFYAFSPKSAPYFISYGYELIVFHGNVFCYQVKRRQIPGFRETGRGADFNRCWHIHIAFLHNNCIFPSDLFSHDHRSIDSAEI